MEAALNKVLVGGILFILGILVKMHRSFMTRDQVKEMVEDVGDYAEDRKLILFRLDHIEVELKNLGKMIRNGHG